MASKCIPPTDNRGEYARPMAESLFENDPRPKLIVTPRCEVIWYSQSAMGLLKPPLPVRLEGKSLRFDRHIQAGRIRGFFDGLGQGVERCLVRGEDKRAWVLMRALRLNDPEGAIGISCDLSKPCLSVVESGLAHEFRLTPTEARVLDLFAELQSPKEIAAKLGISLATVRSHLKQVHAKASVESAVQLLQLIRGYCAA